MIERKSAEQTFTQFHRNVIPREVCWQRNVVKRRLKMAHNIGMVEWFNGMHCGFQVCNPLDPFFLRHFQLQSDGLHSHLHAFLLAHSRYEHGSLTPSGQLTNKRETPKFPD